MLEMVRPARVVAYRGVFMNDLAASLAYAYLIFPLAAKLSMIAPGHRSSPASIGQLPLPLRVILYFVLADFGHYWVHRLIHTQYLWRVHKWHHSPTYMYWLGGVRATLPQQFLVNIPYVIAYPLLDISPWYMAMALGAISTIQNDWMHMNVTWRSNGWNGYSLHHVIITTVLTRIAIRRICQTCCPYGIGCSELISIRIGYRPTSHSALSIRRTRYA